MSARSTFANGKIRFFIILVASGVALCSTSALAGNKYFCDLDDSELHEVGTCKVIPNFRLDPDGSAALCKQALSRAKKGEFDIARRLYERAFDAYPNRDIWFNWGLAALNSGRYLEALRELRLYQQNSNADPKKAAIIESELIPKANAATGHLRLDDAFHYWDVTIDGDYVGYGTPERTVFDVLPGEHVVEIRRERRALETRVTAPVGQETRVVF